MKYGVVLHPHHADDPPRQVLQVPFLDPPAPFGVTPGQALGVQFQEQQYQDSDSKFPRKRSCYRSQGRFDKAEEDRIQVKWESYP